MKKLVLLLFSFVFLTSCTSDDDAGSQTSNLAAVLSVTLPDSFVHAQAYEIEIVYKHPTSCDRFSGFDISKNENEIFIGVVCSHHTSSTNCVDTGNLQDSVILNFVAERDDFYIFNFWQGKNALGEDEFLSIEIPVTQP
ncbi:MAG TPA: hypothetical protein VFD29_07400 [Gillisia sp.]|nr:hypothetical protein [Gillisia sp.]